jgi:hypothetical protein
MSPKEKVDELYWKYYQLVADCSHPEEKAKECALIAVDEILNHHSQEQSLYRIDTYYWKQIKQEIENL